MKDYLLKTGPRTLRVEIIGALVWFVFAFAYSRLLRMDAFQTTVMMLVIPAGQAIRYAWWHFRPYKEDPPQPVTRYTRTRP
jgi:hypothetical protein